LTIAEERCTPFWFNTK